MRHGKGMAPLGVLLMRAIAAHEVKLRRYGCSMRTSDSDGNVPRINVRWRISPLVDVDVRLRNGMRSEASMAIFAQRTHGPETSGNGRQNLNLRILTWGAAWRRKKNRDCTYLFVTAENDESTTARLATFGSPQCPERYRSSTVLSEPTFQLTLCRIVRQSTQVQHFASFSQECANVTPRVEWSLQNLGAALWVRGRRTRLLEQ